MKLFTALVVLVAGLGLAVATDATSLVAGTSAQQQPRKKAADVIKLALDHKLGPVTFSHLNHTSKNYNITGTGPIECIECHHVAQPASEVVKHPPLKTAWPADRTVTLTAATADDPATPEVIGCRNCHAKANTKPPVWPEIPQIKYEGGTALITLINQQAFHRNCAGCHDAAFKERPTIKAPRTTQCTMCHKKGG